MGLYIVLLTPDDEPICGHVARLLAPLLSDDPTVVPFVGRNGEPIPVVEVDGLPPTLEGVIAEIDNVIPLRPRQV